MKSICRLLSPRSIAFIGGTECDVAIRKTRDLGFAGKIWAIHPNRAELGGIATIKSIDEIDDVPDAAFIAVKREPTVDIVRELSRRRCGGAVIYASGFAETGDARLQDRLLDAADGMPLMGPNCYGFVNAQARAALWPDEHGLEPIERGVAIVTQSGNIACNFSMTRRALPCSAVYAIGNQADIDMARMLDALVDDDKITAIGLHVEGLRDIPAFAAAAAKAREAKKPVIALKTGRSEQGAKVALSHTSSLAGADTLYDALFERYGIARLGSITAFVETLKFLHHGGPLKDNRLVSMSCSGGEAALVADMALDRKVCFPAFDKRTKPKVAASLNEYVAVDNPLDYHTFIWNDETKLTATFSAVLSGGFDVAMLILDIPTHPKMRPDTWLVTAKALMNAAEKTGARAAVVASLPECLPLDLAEKFAEHGVVPMLGLDDALAAFEAAAFIGKNWARRDEPVASRHATASPAPIRNYTEHEAKELLAAHGLTIPRGLACKAADAGRAAEDIGFPVVLKVASTAIAHKTEVGGVAVNIASREETEREARRLAEIAPDLLVERMVRGAVAELIVGVTRDPQFGPVLAVGAGGILTEFFKDSVTLLLPTSRAEIERAVTTLKVWRLVEGYRNRAGDTEAALAAIVAIADFAAVYRDRIVELDINPLLVLPPGQGVVAVDALLRMAGPA
jgi:acyl-CoA synthetase (NDP forming)